jgi:5-methylcytosine-specific restriction endonuclease McrA
MPYKDKRKQYAHNLARMQRRRADWLTANGPCKKCGSWKDLEVDHVDPASKVSHRIWSWSDARRAIELAKCQVLCATCHNEKAQHNQEFANGEANGQTKLTAVEVHKIRQASGTLSQIATRFTLPKSTVASIRSGRRWKYA